MILAFPTMDMGGNWVSGFDREWFLSLFLKICVILSSEYPNVIEKRNNEDQTESGRRIQLEVKKTNIDPIASGDRVKLYKFHMHATEKTNMAELGTHKYPGVQRCVLQLLFIFLLSNKWVTDRQMDRWTDGRKQPRIEMRGCI